MEYVALRTNGLTIVEGSFISFFRENKRYQGFVTQILNEYEVIVRTIDSDVHLVALNELQRA